MNARRSFQRVYSTDPITCGVGIVGEPERPNAIKATAAMTIAQIRIVPMVRPRRRFIG
jgi:hypothetical protein